MMIARELRWSLSEVIYGKKVVYESGKGLSEFERDLWVALLMVEKEEQKAEEERQAQANAKAKREAERPKSRR